MKKIVLSMVCLLSGCVNMVNDRAMHVTNKKEIGENIYCPAPPADVVPTAELNLKINEVQEIASSDGISVKNKYQKIREIDPNLQTVETVHYRVCIEYSNGVYSRDEYKSIVESLPLYSSNPRVESSESHQISDLPIRKVVASAGSWNSEELGLSVNVKWIGGVCTPPCEIVLEAGVKVTTSTYLMPNLKLKEGDTLAFTHNNRTYSLKIEKINSKPYYITVLIDEIKA
ncbi:hypothetical protein R5D70_004599 [Vibrio parahaemolyticus]|nr:hypothetical protein [Vibrio parahaemolyticus]MBE4008615.1 hypothetical protein [Vibrio parahaemolyticus]MDF4691936.1 hypothetical protein [Vibrio parahaemolyticus]